jgi:hypothetical protein
VAACARRHGEGGSHDRAHATSAICRWVQVGKPLA